MGQPHLFICTLFPSRLSHEKTVIRPSLFFTISITALPHQFPLMVYWTVKPVAYSEPVIGSSSVRFFRK